MQICTTQPLKHSFAVIAFENAIERSVEFSRFRFTLFQRQWVLGIDAFPAGRSYVDYICTHFFFRFLGKPAFMLA